MEQPGEGIPRLPMAVPLYKDYRKHPSGLWPLTKVRITVFGSKSDSGGSETGSMIRENSEKSIDTLASGASETWWKRGRRGAESKRERFPFYQDNEAKEVDVKGEYSSNGKKSVAKSREAGAPRQGERPVLPQGSPATAGQL